MDQNDACTIAKNLLIVMQSVRVLDGKSLALEMQLPDTFKFYETQRTERPIPVIAYCSANIEANQGPEYYAVVD